MSIEFFKSLLGYCCFMFFAIRIGPVNGKYSLHSGFLAGGEKGDLISVMERRKDLMKKYMVVFLIIRVYISDFCTKIDSLGLAESWIDIHF